MKDRRAIYGAALLVMGFVVGGLTGTLRAQDESTTVDQAWEIYHSRYGDDSFYVVKHNRVTGETKVLDARMGSMDDEWVTFGETDLR